jgi:5-(carboxyamino)imidazole ribonucleotide synthase
MTIRSANRVISPGATIGVLGGGQLGRMFAIAARYMGYRVHTLSPDTDTPTGQIADREVTAAYDDLDAVREFARRVEVVTFEFENVPATTTQAIQEIVLVRPRGEILHITQNRNREKTFLAKCGFPVTPFRSIRAPEALSPALRELGIPAILKTACFGYDGKGQTRISSLDQTDHALQLLGATELVLEAAIDFECELSVVAARGMDGDVKDWGVVRNSHRHHILDVSTAPADVPLEVARAAIEIAHGVLEQLQVVGVLCVEYFLARNGTLMINELAPRPHNSGHLTIDASVTSQFEQQVRAVCGLPLGSTTLLRPAAMVNLLGEIWDHGTPHWAAACRMPDVKLHLYGKSAPREGRKMGHLTALADSPQEAATLVSAARQALLPHDI